MPTKIQTAVLANKIDNLVDKIDSLQHSMEEFKSDIKANTEFRLQAKGMIGLVGILASFVGAVIVWSMDKIWKAFNN